MKRIIEQILVGAFFAFLLGGAISFWALPDREFSLPEKRGLQSFPRFDTETLLSGRFASEMNDYFADQFPARNLLVGLKGRCELWLGKGENNGILIGKNGQLARRTFDMRLVEGRISKDSDLHDRAHIDRAIEGILRADAALDVPFAVLLPPRTLDVASSAFSYPRDGSDVLERQLRNGLQGWTRYVDLLPRFRALYESGEYVYYKTDHHWTTLGAYFAYEEVMRAFDMESVILPQDVFRKKTVATDFYGTFYASGSMRFVSPDRVEVWTVGNEADFLITADGQQLPSFYAMAHLERKDPYAIFLDGTHDVVTVSKKDGEKRPRLLLPKDSFANSLAPFLAQHFDLILLNLSSVRRDYTNISTLAREYDADAVLLVYTLGNVISTDRMNRLQ